MPPLSWGLCRPPWERPCPTAFPWLPGSSWLLVESCLGILRKPFLHSTDMEVPARLQPALPRVNELLGGVLQQLHQLQGRLDLATQG